VHVCERRRVSYETRRKEKRLRKNRMPEESEQRMVKKIVVDSAGVAGED